MIAAVTVGHGGPDQIEVRSDWPCPTPGPGEALVGVTAAALNNTDIWSRQGAYGTAADPQLFGVYITNFLCAPDSFIVSYFRRVMKQKPSLTLELDDDAARSVLILRLAR